jgi:hypothetical protein
VNCKQGDLAVFVGTKPMDPLGVPHLGKIVRIVAPAVHPDAPLWGWEISPMLGEHNCTLDAALRPIRPGDVSDEDVRELYAPKLPEVDRA